MVIPRILEPGRPRDPGTTRRRSHRGATTLPVSAHPEFLIVSR